jgi:preprotein translocase subunit SecA
VVTVNDYLAQRDAQWVEPLFHFLGLSVGVVVQSSDAAQRADHYRQHVCYCTNAELVFDYLRDLSCLRSRGPLSELSAERYHPPQDMRRIPSLDFAIVDEADSILIDEARTPLILSAAQGRQIEEAVVARVVDYAQTLELERHYRLSAGATRVQLTERGIADARQAFADAQSGALFLDSYREELIVMALTALRLYHRDEHYLVKDEQVQIIDEYTGRAMPDRRWSAGLHQMVEYKEACPQSEPNHTVARISYQRFFTRYQTLAGMTGTAAEVAPELWRIYGLRVIPVATHRPVKRKLLADRVYADREQKLQALVERVTAIHSSGAPVLIGTRTVGASVEVASMLSEAGLNYDCLNAADDAQEADIVARAGERGSITVATNMAGRGTDIPLGDGVEALGGLHVLMTERHDAGRIDRQLMGRCGRQGSAGCFEVLQSLDDPLVRWVRPVWLLYLARVLLPVDGGWLARYLLARGQRRLEREHSRIRQRLYRSDQSEAEMLAFAGRSE